MNLEPLLISMPSKNCAKNNNTWKPEFLELATMYIASYVVATPMTTQHEYSIISSKFEQGTTRAQNEPGAKPTKHWDLQKSQCKRGLKSFQCM